MADDKAAGVTKRVDDAASTSGSPTVEGGTSVSPAEDSSAVIVTFEPPGWLQAARKREPTTGRSKKAGAYYSQQQDLIDSYNQSHEPPPNAAQDAEAIAGAARAVARVSLIVKLCFVANVLLLASNIFVVVWSASLAVVAASIDCALDLLSTTIIYFTAKKQAKAEPHLYPVGKSRLEPLSIIIFASIMSMAAMQLVVESAQSIGRTVSSGEESLNVDTLAIVLLAISIGVKFLLMLMCYCMRSLSDSVHALAMEYRNDGIITLGSLVAIIIASRVPAAWWLDPAVAIAMSVLILYTWIQTGKEHLVLLAGKVAEPSLLSKLTYIAAHHDVRVTHVDTVRAYYNGAKVIAEVDIVLPRAMPLDEAHDVGDALQKSLERVEFVERAFVHLDYEFSHTAQDEHSGTA